MCKPSKSSNTKRIHLNTYMDRAEFISSKTDTKQRLGELFIYAPTKLESSMFPLLCISVRAPLLDYQQQTAYLQA